MNTNETTVTVKQYQAETFCKCCGRDIKNVVEINGVQYGTRCCEGFLPRFAKLGSNGVLTVDYKAAAFESLGQERAIRFWAQPISQLEAYVERARERGSDTVAGVEYILLAKKG